jgi:hypothetical protein
MLQTSSKCSKLLHTCSLVLNHPRKAASTPRTNTDLALNNYRGNMHTLRINTSEHSKIGIISPEVQLDITRQKAEVGHKNIYSFSYKNHLDRFCIKGKYFI